MSGRLNLQKGSSLVKGVSLNDKGSEKRIKYNVHVTPACGSTFSCNAPWPRWSIPDEDLPVYLHVVIVCCTDHSLPFVIL